MALMIIPGSLLNSLAGMIEESAAAVWPSAALREIRRLQNTLEIICSVVGDADGRRMEDIAINIWVKELNDVLYDAFDVMDLCHLVFAEQMQSMEQQAPAPLVCWPPSLFFNYLTKIVRRLQIATRIREINDRLEKISNDRNKYNLQAVNPNVQHTVVSHRTSSIVSPDVVGVGIDIAAGKMIDLLLQEHGTGNQIFAITGMGGIGKTTLAQKIYNGYRLQAHFEIRIWVYVSRYFSETDLLRGIISFTSGESSTNHTKQQLQERLFTVIQGRKFFLVLDDVWSTDAWEHVLRDPFQKGAPGSRIIVTTRDEDVAKRMQVGVHIHKVSPLSNKDSWSLLCKTVFMDEDDRDIDGLRDIGLKIVNKCEGLPLALKFAGETLRTKERSPREWERVFKSLTSFKTRFNKQFMGALYLSYEALPYHLRLCFLYCSLFLENRIIARSELVQLWIAEGFVKPDPDSTLEEVAEDYYKQIAANSLLRLEADEGCRMHDVLRDLALHLAEDDIYAGDLEKLSVPAEVKLRRLSIASRETISSPSAITHHKSLRALLIFDSPLADEALRDLLHQLGHLRVLDLRGTEINEVPSSLGKLWHLRYLNLSRTRIQGLPESIKELRYLQFLNLNRCTNLRHLPTGITQLHNLRRLDLLYSAVDQIPSGIGRLKHLNTFLGYVVSHGDHALEELENLNRLCDLNIRKLERAEAENISPLENKDQLRSLVLSCGAHPVEDDVVMRIANVFDYLRPPVCLEQLTIEGYFGIEYPEWMFSPSDYTTLVRLNLKSCTFCRRLPPLGQLRLLNYLWISASLEIVYIGTEFFGDSIQSFPSLEILVIEDMPNWEEWHGPKGGALPRLRQMHLKRCPKLRYLPRCLQYSTALTELEIEAADSIRAIEDLVSLTQLRIEDCPNLGRISYLPSLETLKIIKCPLLVDVERVQVLQHMVLEDFALESLPKWLTPTILQTLHTLDITGNQHLLKRLQTDVVERQKISDILHLNVRPL